MNVTKGIKGARPVPLVERFWARVVKGDGCWLWTGAARGPAGRDYGTIWVGGRSRPAAQVSVELATGQPWPTGMDACHRCDTPRCVRPDHIFAGTARDNARDSVAKRRHPLTARDVCKHGHPFTAENVLMRGTIRVCRMCQRRRKDAFLARAALSGKDGAA